MPLFDFIGTGVSLRSGAEIKLPTVRAFFRALQVYGPEIAAVREAIRRSPDGGLRAEVAIAPFVATRTDARLVYVLEGLVAPGSLKTEAATQETLLGFVAVLAPNLAAINDLLGGDEDAEAPEPGAIAPAVQRIFDLAERLKIDPMVIVGWPLGVFLDALEHYSRKPDGSTDQSFPASEPPPALHIAGLGG